MNSDRPDRISKDPGSQETGHVTHAATSALLGYYWLPVSGLLFFFGLTSGKSLLLLVSLLFFLAGSISRIWDRFCLSRVTFSRELSSNRVFFGEEIWMETRIANRKVLPLPWLELVDQVPTAIEMLEGNASTTIDGTRRTITRSLTLHWYERATWRHHFRCNHRGCFLFGPTRISSGDIFGVFHKEMTIGQESYLLVYPKMLPLEELGIMAKQPLGNRQTQKTIFQDPSLHMGVREYQFGDNLKHIHWKATARTQRLQTRIYDSTSTMDFSLFLDVRTGHRSFLASSLDVLELLAVTAASIARQVIEDGHRVGLYSNSRIRFPDGIVRVPPSQHRSQLLHILESLSQVNGYEAMPIDELIIDECRNLSWGSTIAVISAAPTDELISVLLSLRKAGRQVTLIETGGGISDGYQNGLSIHHVPVDVNWQEMESLTI